MYSYNVSAIYDNNRYTLETNDVNAAISALLSSAEDGVPVHLVNGFTGEVLACANTGDDTCTDEMSLMIIGHLCASAWGE
jgi:hypothetical protein